jgi:hypothetical protein
MLPSLPPPPNLSSSDTGHLSPFGGASCPYNNFSSQANPMTTTTINGVQFKVTRLPIAHGAKANRWADRIKGGSSRVRTGAGSRSVHQSTKASALADVR